jgi:hypothetical protein
MTLEQGTQNAADDGPATAAAPVGLYSMVHKAACARQVLGDHAQYSALYGIEVALAELRLRIQEAKKNTEGESLALVQQLERILVTGS